MKAIAVIAFIMVACGRTEPEPREALAPTIPIEPSEPEVHYVAAPTRQAMNLWGGTLSSSGGPSTGSCPIFDLTAPQGMPEGATSLLVEWSVCMNSAGSGSFIFSAGQEEYLVDWPCETYAAPKWQIRVEASRYVAFGVQSDGVHPSNAAVTARLVGWWAL